VETGLDETFGHNEGRTGFPITVTGEEYWRPHFLPVALAPFWPQCN